MFPNKVKIVEVGPRDGLQNESVMVPTNIKIQWINLLSETGLSVIETTSFVSPKWVPQLADHDKVFSQIKKNSNTIYPVFVPNLHGFENALAVGAKEVSIFTTPSEKFSQKNINASVQQNLENVKAVILAAKKNHVRVRGYISCVLGCPYEGEISPEKVSVMAEQLMQFGCDEISLGDTIGVGTPLKTKNLIQQVKQKVPTDKIGVHFHDTFGQALANIYVALEEGIAIVDSSTAGLGGCPYAKGASGNVATEDVLYMLQGMNIQTNVDLNKIILAGRFIMDFLKKPPRSKVSLALK